MLLSLLFALPALGAPTPDWTALPLPSLCEQVGATSFPVLNEGTHLSWDWSTTGASLPEPGVLAPGEVSNLLGLSANASGVDLDLFFFAPPLLAQGSSEDLDWARAELAGLDRAGQRHRIELRALLYPGELDQDAASELLTRSQADPTVLPEGARAWHHELRPGQTVALGRRERQPCLLDYSVNVATDSGVAAPIIGSVFTGKTLHLSASRIERGGRVHLRGWLDMAEADELQRFDPASPDLGQLEQPSVRSLTVAFSGVTGGEGALRVQVQGAPLAQRDWSLFVFASTQAEPEALDPHDWLALDVSLLARPGLQLAALSPGAGLEDQARLDPLRTLAEPISAAGILTAAAPRGRNSRSGAGASRPALHVGDTLILLSAARVAQDEEGTLDSILSAMESARLGTDQLTLRHGDLSVAFPVAQGEPARVVVGSERTLLVGYDAEIAPNTWMPAPRVERVFDGLAWQGRRDSGEFHNRAWISSTASVAALTREEANMGALQLPSRQLRQAAGRLSGPGPTVLLRALADAAALTVSLGSN